MTVMNAAIRAQLPLDPPLPAPGMPAPLGNPVPLIDPAVPGQDDPVRDPPVGDPLPANPSQAASQGRTPC